MPALISSAYGKTLLSLSGIQDMQNSIREWIKSFVPEGEEMGDVSDSQIAGFEQTAAEACAPDLRFFSGSVRATMLSYEKGALCPLPLPGRL